MEARRQSLVISAVRDRANLLVRRIEHGDAYELEPAVLDHGLAHLGEELAAVLSANDRVVDLAQRGIEVLEARCPDFGGLLSGNVLAHAAVAGELPAGIENRPAADQHVVQFSVLVPARELQVPEREVGIEYSPMFALDVLGLPYVVGLEAGLAKRGFHRHAVACAVARRHVRTSEMLVLLPVPVI